MDKGKISVIIPSYNQGQFLGETIESIIAQDYDNFEIIVIDGGSTDSTLEVIAKYADRIAYWVSEPDGGQTAAINKGYKVATGEIIGWQNSDDVYEPGAFRTVVEAFEAHPDADLVYGNYRLIDQLSRVVKTHYVIDFHLATKLYENTIVYNQALFWKKAFSDRLIIPDFGGPFNERMRFVMDAEFVYRCHLAGGRFRRVRKVLGAFRMHPDNKTSNMHAVFVEEYDRIRREMYPRYSPFKERLFKYPLKARRLLLSLLSR